MPLPPQAAEREAQLPHLAALRHPRRLQVVEVVEDDARERQRAEVIDARRFGAAEFGVIRLVAPRDERGEAARLVLQRRAAASCARCALRRSRRCRTSSSPWCAGRRDARRASRQAIRRATPCRSS